VKTKRSAEQTYQYTLDTSALIAYLAQEPGGERLAEVRHAAAIPCVVVTELYYTTWRRQGQPLADVTIQHVLGWHLPLLTPNERISLFAGSLKARHRLGLADSYIAAFALSSGTTLVTKDADFRILEPQLRLLFLS
jgi:predicted nucleic acid-binding protein